MGENFVTFIVTDGEKTKEVTLYLEYYQSPNAVIKEIETMGLKCVSWHRN